MAKPGLHLNVLCEICGIEYRQSKSTQRFCSGKCASRAWHRRIQVYRNFLCSYCGRPGKTTNPRQRWCSKRCCGKSRLLKRATGEGKGWSGGRIFVPRTACHVCGVAFYAPPAQRKRGGGKFCSRTCRAKELASHPELYPQTKNRRGIGGKRSDLGNQYFRSIWEANWARYLNWLQKLGEIRSWKFEPDTFEFRKIKRGSRFYTPDFRVMTHDGGIEYHEIKGYMDDRSATKLKRMAKYYPHIKLVLIDKQIYQHIASKVSGFIEGWESSKGRAL